MRTNLKQNNTRMYETFKMNNSPARTMQALIHQLKQKHFAALKKSKYELYRIKKCYTDKVFPTAPTTLEGSDEALKWRRCTITKKKLNFF